MTNNEAILEKKFQAIRTHLNSLEPHDLIFVHNQFLDTICLQDYFIYDMEMFNQIHEGMAPLDIIKDCHAGDFSHRDAYFWIDALGAVYSSNHPEIDCIDTHEIASYAVDEMEGFGIPEIEEILKSEV